MLNISWETNIISEMVSMLNKSTHYVVSINDEFSFSAIDRYNRIINSITLYNG